MTIHIRLSILLAVCMLGLRMHAQQPFYADRVMNLANGVLIGLNSSVLAYHTIYGFAALGGGGSLNSSNLTGNAVDQGERQNTNPQIFPPRVAIGLSGIALGISSVYMADHPAGFNIENPKKLRNLGIAGISMGVAGILLPPVIRMIPLGRQNGKESAPANVPPLQGSLNFGLNPSSGSAGLWLSF